MNNIPTESNVDAALRLVTAIAPECNGHILANAAIVLADEVRRLRSRSYDVYNGHSAKTWYEAFTSSIGELVKRQSAEAMFIQAAKQTGEENYASFKIERKGNP